MSLIVSEMISEGKGRLSPNPVLGSEPKGLVPSDVNINYIASDVRQKVMKNWSLGDLTPLSKVPIGRCRPQNGSKLKKESPKKSSKTAEKVLGSEDFFNYIQRVDNTIETVVKSSDSELVDTMNGSFNGVLHTTEAINGLTDSSFNNSIETKAEVINGFDVNNCNNGFNQNHSQKSQQMSKKRPKVQKNIRQLKRRKDMEANVLHKTLSHKSFPNNKNSWNESNETSSDIVISDYNAIKNNVTNGLIGQQLVINAENDNNLSEKRQKDKEIKPKKGRKPKTASNLSFPAMKIKTSALFKQSNPYFNSFQQFLNKKSEKPVITTNNPNSVLKYTKYRKVKSETQLMAKKKVNQLRGIKFLNVKIKRNRKKPLIIKNLTESKSFLDFVSKKFPPIKEGVPFIQDRSCKELTKDFESSNLNYCMDCNEEKRGPNSQTCRFFQYRTIIKTADKLSVYAFAEEGNATNDDCKIWLPVAQSKHLDERTAIYLLIFVGQQFCRIYSEERQIESRFMSVTWKKPVKGIRELCDICDTTIFNAHYVCPKCGLAVCKDCFSYRESQSTTVLSHSSRKNHDDFGWILCTDKQNHDLKAFHLAIFITRAVFGSIDTTYHRIRNEFRIMGICDCDRLLPELNLDMRKTSANLDIRQYHPTIPRQWLCDDKLLVLTDPKYFDNLRLFQINWLKGYPVVIERVNESLNQELWSPRSFNFNFGRQTSRLVNCMNGQIIPRRQMSYFWEGFEDVDQRLVDEETGEEMILKLKDWPPNAEFRDMLPLWFDNLMDALPLHEYTRYNGNRNLASRLPEFFVRPDLGPKMYCAYGSVLHPDKGTTNLHLDMSDAVNVMIYVGVAKKDNKPLQSHLDEANDTLLKGGCDPKMMARANSASLKVGALWHIWKAEDADKIRHFLNKVAKERHMRIESNNDPIHDQSWYLDQTLRTRLENEYNVKGLAIAQCLGDAILVPAGAPHQVQNIHSCIKVAGEFVSPENVAHCLAMTQQFRNLSKRHNNHEDKLQIKNIIYHTIKDCLSVLLPPVHNYFPIPSPPRLMSQIMPLIANNSLNTKLSPYPISDKEHCKSLDTSLTLSDNKNCDQILVNNSDISQKCADESLFPDKTLTVNENCVLGMTSTDSVKVVPIVCSESQVVEIESSQVQSSESPSISKLSCPPSLVIPFQDSSNAFEDLSPPPVLTPYSYELQSNCNLKIDPTQTCPPNSSHPQFETKNS